MSGHMAFPTLGGMQLWTDVFVHAGWCIQAHALTRTHRLLGPGNIQRAWGDYEHCRAVFERVRSDQRLVPSGDHLVLLLHGIFSSKQRFFTLRRALRRAGYDAVAVNYASTRASVASHAADLVTLLDRVEGARTVSFVGHSLGGLVCRLAIARGGAWRGRLEVNRLVTLGTPHQGTEVAEWVRLSMAARAMAGPVLDDVRPRDLASFPLPDCRIGTVAGGRGDGRGYNPLVAGDDDGLISLESALLDSAEDQLLVRCTHALLPRHRPVVEGTVRYLATGRFVDQGAAST